MNSQPHCAHHSFPWNAALALWRCSSAPFRPPAPVEGVSPKAGFGIRWSLRSFSSQTIPQFTPQSLLLFMALYKQGGSYQGCSGITWVHWECTGAVNVVPDRPLITIYYKAYNPWQSLPWSHPVCSPQTAFPTCMDTQGSSRFIQGAKSQDEGWGWAWPNLRGLRCHQELFLGRRAFVKAQHQKAGFSTSTSSSSSDRICLGRGFWLRPRDVGIQSEVFRLLFSLGNEQPGCKSQQDCLHE